MRAGFENCTRLGRVLFVSTLGPRTESEELFNIDISDLRCTYRALPVFSRRTATEVSGFDVYLRLAVYNYLILTP
jgi:hypothetical protein